MIRRILGFAFLVLAFAIPARAQTPIIIGPLTQLQWDMPALTLAQAQACTYAVSVNSGAFVPVIGPVTCAAPAPTCGVNLVAQTAIPVGSNSLTMTATCSGVTSLPSVPFAYVDVIIPIPSNLRIK